MLRTWFVELLMAAGDAPAQGAAPGGKPPNPLGGLSSLLVPMAAVFFIFWLLVFRPEAKKRKLRELMIANVKKGDTVLTTGGLLGKVWRVDAREVTVIIDTDGEVKSRFTKNAILEVIDPEALAKGGDGSSRN